jgi:hypothetical protein
MHSRGVYVIDVCELTANEVMEMYPAAYQRLFDRVKPERDTNNRKSRRENWWIYGEPCDSPGVSDTGGGVVYAADAGAWSAGNRASNWLGDW